jgi:hypothetical protein
LLAGYDALLTVPDCQEDSASAWSWIFHLCFSGSWMRFYDGIRLFPTVIASSDQIRPRCLR